MDLILNHLAHVRYTKTTDLGSSKYKGHIGEISERVILPTYIPSDNVKALDVSSLTEAEALKLQSYYEEYVEYVETKMATIFNFEDWLDHTKGRTYPDLKYRTFKVDSLLVIKSE